MLSKYAKFLLILIISSFFTSLVLSNPFTNADLSESFNDGTRDRPLGWDFQDGETYEIGMSSNAPSGYDPVGGQQQRGSWETNGFDDYAEISQEVDLSNVEELTFNMNTGGGSNTERSENLVRVDGNTVKNCGTFSSGEQDCTADLSDYNGYHEVALARNQVSGDNLGTWGFDDVRVDSTNSPPIDPTNPSPDNNEDTVELEPELTIDVSDPDGDDMDVTFYDASDDSVIGADNGVLSGSTASVSTSDESIGSSQGEEYEWYVEADDGEETTQSDTWSFDTVHEPNEPESPSPNDEVLDVPEDSDLEVDVSHPDDLDMDVTFRKDDGDGWSTAGTDTSVGDGDTASINPDLDLSEDYDWYAEASAEGLTTQSDTWSFETEHSFEVEDLRPEDDSESVAVDPVLEADVVHSSSEDEIEVVFYDGDGSELGTDSVSDGETASLDTEGLDFGGEPGEVYEWYVEAVDEQSSTEDIVSETQSFTTLSLPDRPEILSPEGSGVEIDSDFEVEVAHPDGEEMFVEITLETVDGEFVDDLTGDYEDTVIDNFDPELSYDTEYNLSAKSQVTDSNDNIHSSSNWEVFETELAPEELVSSETNNTDPNNAELDFSLDNSVQSIEVTDHGDETVGLDSDPDTQASIGLPKLEPDKEYEWTVEADTDEGPRTVDFNFTTIELEVEVDDVDSAESYNVYRSLEGEDDYELTSSGELEDSIVFDSGEGLEEGEVYCYKVSGVSEEGVESDLSDEECMEAETEVSPP